MGATEGRTRRASAGREAISGCEGPGRRPPEDLALWGPWRLRAPPRPLWTGMARAIPRAAVHACLRLPPGRKLQEGETTSHLRRAPASWDARASVDAPELIDPDSCFPQN